MKLLFVEDEPVLIEEMETYFKSLDFICEKAVSFRQAEDKLTSYSYDVVVLDITLPDGNGIDLIPIIREANPDAGVLILSAKDSVQDKVKGLNLGADDYLSKPFFVEELNARINALFRRKAFKGSEEVLFDHFRIDLSAKLLFYRDEPLSLTRKEYEMLLYFVVNKGRVLSKASIAEHLWGDHFDQADNFDALYVHIKNLRKKLIAASGTDYLKSMYGMGYKLTF